MNFDLTESQKDILISILKDSLQEGTVIVFGSRATKKNTQRSDIDIALKNPVFKNKYSIHEIIDKIDEFDFPYLVDLLIYEELKNTEIKKHIDTYGKLILKICPDT